MSYGDGSQVPGGLNPLTTLDISAHEVGHAVCSFTAGLVYQRESGAMNEGFSDIWGASIGFFGEPTKDPWLIGKGVKFGMGITAGFRSMSNPKLNGLPDTYGGQFWQNVTPAVCPVPDGDLNDQCGVHTNSSVLNKWFYLVTIGGSGTNDVGNTYSVTGLGMDSSQVIAYQTELLLTPNATYADCRAASINVATARHGACSNEVIQVTNAWFAVGVGNAFIQCGPNVNFEKASESSKESVVGAVSGCRKYTDYTYQIVMGVAPSVAAIATLTYGGTATKGLDYEVTTNGDFATPSNDITFGTGTLTPQIFTVRIYDDATVESPETIVLSYALNNGGGNATQGTTIPTFTITLTDNDTAPTGYATVNATIGAGANNLVEESPLKSSFVKHRAQYLFTAGELHAAGIPIKATINNLTFFVSTKNSTKPYTGFTVGLANSANTVLNDYVKETLTTVYNGNYSTVAGDNVINFGTPFVWDGVSSLAVNICFENATADAAADVVLGDDPFTSLTVLYANYTAGATAGCDLPVGFGSVSRPKITFGANYGVLTETAASTSVSSYLGTNSNEYYYSSNNKLIANISGINNLLGCTPVTLEGAGTTWLTYGGGLRSAKVFLVTPTTNGSTATYTASFYFDNAELAGKNPATVRLFKTSAASASLADATNTVSVTPTVTTLGANTTVFTAPFTGFSRYFLADNNVVILPLTLLDFTANLQNKNDAILQWQTATETNTKGFDIEMAKGNAAFKNIGFVAGKGTSTVKSDYGYKVANLAAGTYSFRLKMVDKDGRSTFSTIRTLIVGGNGVISIYPTPVHSQLTVVLSAENAKAQLQLVNALGQVMAVDASTSGTNRIFDMGQLSKGVYLLKIWNGNKLVSTQKIIKD